MITNDLISIIIPFYNCQRYIASCVNSIIKQTYSNWEAIFVNDGSTDINDMDEEFLKFNDSRIKYFTLKKSGVSVARNYGIDKAIGKYIAFMDIDDELDNKFLEILVNSLNTNNTDVVLCNYNNFFSNGKIEHVSLPWKNQVINSKTIKDELIPNMICCNIRGLVWRTFTTKNFIKKNNLKFIEGIVVAEDLLFTIQLYNRANSIFIVQDYLYNYKCNSLSTLNKYRNDNIENQIHYHNIFLNLLKEEHLYDLNIKNYELNKIGMYCPSISNAVRNNNLKEEYAELSVLRQYFLKEKINYKQYPIPYSRKISMLLLKNNCLILLIVIYKIKEFIRLKKLN